MKKIIVVIFFSIFFLNSSYATTLIQALSKAYKDNPKLNAERENLIWRKHVNEKLKKEYKKLFSMIDHLIFMKIPNFNMVFKWRLLQEKKLEKKSHLKKEIMSYNEIKRFIMFYERITLQMVKDLSKSASVLILLKKNHEIKKTLFRL